MSGEQLRWTAVGLFAVGAVLSGVGNATGRHWLVALAFVCLALGGAAVFRARARARARVLDREEKTSPEGSE